MSAPEKDSAEAQASAQMDSVAQMVAALSVDWGRLHELGEEYNAYQDSYRSEGGDADASGFADASELAELESAAGDCEDQDDAERRIDEDALSVEVRSDWCAPGEEMTAGEYRIVLCTGGPHVEMRGDLSDYGSPRSARLMYQDWGTPLTEYFGDNLDRDALIAYASQFLAG